MKGALFVENEKCNADVAIICWLMRTLSFTNSDRPMARGSEWRNTENFHLMDYETVIQIIRCSYVQIQGTLLSALRQRRSSLLPFSHVDE